MTISGCLIVKNEENVLKRCLDSFSPLLDEIIVVDTGSSDKTKEIAASYDKVKLFDYKWKDDFGDARNTSFGHATGDYLMWIDADDYLDEKSLSVLKTLKDNNTISQFDSIYMPYVNFKNNDMSSSEFFPFNRHRIVKRECGFKWEGKIHEYLNVVEFSNNFLTLSVNEAFITHLHDKPYTDRNLKIYRKMEKKNEILTARDTFYYANELFDNNLYEEAAKWYIKALEFKDLWRIDALNACAKMFNIYYNHLDNSELAVEYAFKSFKYSKPRADICCYIGLYFLDNNNNEMAKYWYEKAYNNIPYGDESTFVTSSHWTTTPLLQLCVIHWRMGAYISAAEINELVGKYDPLNPNYLYNISLFSKMRMEYPKELN